MPMVLINRDQLKRVIRRRRLMGADRFDEVWNGVYVMSPIANNEHQFVAGKIYTALEQAMAGVAGALVFPAINVSDLQEKWRKNYRCPDAAVFLSGNPAVDKGAYWFGGPDFVVEVISPYDRSRKKLDFYAKVGVRELLLVDRKPWSLELYCLIGGELKLIRKITPDSPQPLTSEVLPLSFRLIPGESRPGIEMTHTADARKWLA